MVSFSINCSDMHICIYISKCYLLSLYVTFLKKYEALHKFVCHPCAVVALIFSVLSHLYATCMYGFRDDSLVLDDWSSLERNTSVPIFPPLPLVLCAGLRPQALPYPC